MTPVVLISPYRGANPAEIKKNAEYACRCVLDSLYNHSEAPFAAHLLYSQMLDQSDDEQFKLGMQAQEEWIKSAVRIVVYTDNGFTEGMNDTINKSGKPCVMRSLGVVTPAKEPA